MQRLKCTSEVRSGGSFFHEHILNNLPYKRSTQYTFPIIILFIFILSNYYCRDAKAKVAELSGELGNDEAAESGVCNPPRNDSLTLFK